MLLNKTIEIWNIGVGSSDVNNIFHEGVLEKVKPVRANVQPYSSARLKKDYGFELDVTKRVFIKFDASIQKGTVIKYKTPKFDESFLEVKEFIPWDSYIEIFCLDTTK